MSEEEVFNMAEKINEVVPPRMPRLGEIVIYQVLSNDDCNVRHNHVDELPAVVVRVWGDDVVNLKVLTDGPHDVWMTSVQQGDEPGYWYRPQD